MPDVRGAARAVLSHAGPLYRIASAWAHPVNEGARLRAAGRVLTHEVLTRGFGRPLVVPIGTHSKIIARRGETNSPHAVRGNPPNDEMHVWRAYLRPGDLFVDVGANIGICTRSPVTCPRPRTSSPRRQASCCHQSCFADNRHYVR